MRSLLIWAAIAAPAILRAQPGGDTLALVGVHVVTLEAGDSLHRDQTVLVADGRIVALGPRQDVVVPPTARRLDVSGRFVMPGLVDAHVHLEHFDDPAVLRAFLRHGVTSVRNLDGRPQVLAWRARVARGELLGPRIVTAGPILDGDPPLRDDNLAVASPDAARAAVRDQHAAGYDFVKVYSRLSDSAYAATLEAARALGMPVAGHVPIGVDLQSALASGQYAIEHLTDFDDAIERADSPTRGRFHWSRLYLAIPADSLRMESIAAVVAQSGTWVVPTLIVADRALAGEAEVARVLADPTMRWLPAGAAEQWRAAQRRSTARLGPEDDAVIRRGRENRAALLRALHRAGARLAVGTDTPNPFVIPGASLHDELVALQRSGLSAREVLALSVQGGAGILGCPQRCGRVAPGHNADLLVLQGDPQVDLAFARSPTAVIVSGRWIATEALAAP